MYFSSIRGASIPNPMNCGLTRKETNTFGPALLDRRTAAVERSDPGGGTGGGREGYILATFASKPPLRWAGGESDVSGAAEGGQLPLDCLRDLLGLGAETGRRSRSVGTPLLGGRGCPPWAAWAGAGATRGALLADDCRGDVLKRFVDVIGEQHGLHLSRGDNTPVGQELPVDGLLPVGLANEHDGEGGLLSRLLQCDALKQLVKRSEPTRARNEGLAGVEHPVLAGEEVVEGKGQFWSHVGVQSLLKRKRDRETRRARTVDLERPAVGGLHQARPAAGGHNEVLTVGGVGLALHEAVEIGRTQGVSPLRTLISPQCCDFLGLSPLREAAG
eukprot:Hpha_TRINITY_DN2798_c0_g1::TRINITY_DN2798_c0_g1_i1::g.110320::m.110320